MIFLHQIHKLRPPPFLHHITLHKPTISHLPFSLNGIPSVFFLKTEHRAAADSPIPQRKRNSKSPCLSYTILLLLPLYGILLLSLLNRRSPSPSSINSCMPSSPKQSHQLISPPAFSISIFSLSSAAGSASQLLLHRCSCSLSLSLSLFVQAIRDGADGKYMLKRDAKLREDYGSKRAQKEAKMKAMHDSLELSQEEMKARFAKFSGGQDLTHAHLHAEKMSSSNSHSTLQIKDQR